MNDLERVVSEQAAEIKKLRRACRTLGGTLTAEIATMQAATIAERLQPGSGMAWIDQSLVEAWTYPAVDNEDAYWDGNQSAEDWFQNRMAEDRAWRRMSEEPS